MSARITPLPLKEWPPEMREALAALTPPEPRHPDPSTGGGRPKALNALGAFQAFGIELDDDLLAADGTIDLI